MSLNIYEDSGFKLFPCKADKSPSTTGFYPVDESLKKFNRDGKEIPNRDWKQSENHISIDKASSIQETGGLIGAWIPSDIIIMDLDRHEGKADGVESFKELKEKLGLNLNFMTDTAFVKTGGNGYHVFFYAGNNHSFKQGELKVNGEKLGIDIKTSKGYVIASGSGGYETLCDYEPMEMPEVLKEWIIRTQEISSKTELKEEKKDNTNKKHISPKLLKSILNKVDVTSFRSNDRWLEFIMSAIATAGRDVEVIRILEDWSESDPEYSHDKSLFSRINSIDEDGGITTGTFINLLREEDLSQYLIGQVVKLNTLSTAVLECEEQEGDLIIKEPNYNELIEMPEMKEFFTTQGNSAAKKILYAGLNNNVVYVKVEKEIFYFNGSRWEVLKDMYSLVYTILFRAAKTYYLKQEDSKENQDRMMKTLKSINDTTWKSKTITELQAMVREDFVNWDASQVAMETVTTIDGVIDFRDGKITKRKGHRSEFRKSYISYTSDEVLKASYPKHYLSFMQGSFPDEDTLKMAHQLVSLCISGNTAKRIFQLWEGEGSNGKSTLIEIIKEIMKGKTNTYNSNLLMPDKFAKAGQVTPDLAKFIGSYAAMATEVEQTSEFSMGTIKNLSGGDTITVNPKFKESRDVEPTWQLILAVNDLPRFNSTDEAFIGRLSILPFVMRFPRDESEAKKFMQQGTPKEHIGKMIDKNKLLKGIYSEKASIIKYWIDTYVSLEQSGGKIFQSELAKNKKNFYVQDNDDFGKFIEDVCVMESNSFCTSEQITEAFKDYLGLKKASAKWVVSSIKKHNRSITTASREVMILGEYGIETKKRRRGLVGIRIKDQNELSNINADDRGF